MYGRRVSEKLGPHTKSIVIVRSIAWWVLFMRILTVFGASEFPGINDSKQKVFADVETGSLWPKVAGCFNDVLRI
jgi:hypothetical protein